MAVMSVWLAIISSIEVSHAFSYPAQPTARTTTAPPRSTAASALSFSSRCGDSCSCSTFHYNSKTRRQHQWRKHGRRPIVALSSTASISGDEQPPSTSAVDNNEEITKLKKENELLQVQLQRAQRQNELLKQQETSTDTTSQRITHDPIPYEQQRIILEDFEGELTTASQVAVEDEICEYDEDQNKWIPGNGIGECPIEPNVSFINALKSRAYWLVGLLAVQSCSGFILSRNELLLQNHPVIIYFLTMLVGAGGNAGNQASVRVIRGIALGTLNSQTQSQFLSRELRMAFGLSAILSVAGFFRAVLFQTPFPETFAVTVALSIIVFSSICLGAVLPLLLQNIGVDPAHSSTTIQVVMDILGVVLTVFVSMLVLDSVWGQMLIKDLSSNLGL